MVEETPFSTDYAGATAGVPLACNFHVDSSQEIFMAVLPVGETVFVAVDLADYTVNDLGGGLFSVTPGLTYPASTTVKVFRWLEYTQPFYFDETGPLPAKRIEAMGDRLCMEIQQLRGEVGLDGPPITPPPPWNLAALGKLVMTWQELVDAIAAEYPVIQFGANITNEGPLEVPPGIKVNILPYRLVQSGANTVMWNGPLDPARVQVFQGFTASQITGTFGTGRVIPEWWGLIGDSLSNGEHDVAINCAIQCSAGNPGRPVVVSLDGREYFIKRPLDLRERASRISGVSSGTTAILGTSTWNPGVWEAHYLVGSHHKPDTHASITSITNNGDGTCTLVVADGGTAEIIAGETVRISGSSVAGYNAVWPVVAVIDYRTVKLTMPHLGATTGAYIDPVTLDSEMESGANSGSAAIWLGGIAIGDYFTGVERVSIGMIEATKAHPQKRISGISWTTWLEEQTIVYDVVVSGFSGYGIGGNRDTDVSVINGLTIEKFWIMYGTRRFAVPIYIPRNAIVCAVRDGTIDMTITQENSVVGPNTYKTVPQQYGILAAGSHTIIENVHIESVGNGVHVYDAGVGGSVSIRGVDCMELLDFPMRYTQDTARRKWPIPDFAAELALDNLNDSNPYIFHNGVCVSIGKQANGFRAAYNTNMPVTIENITQLGASRYVLLDDALGVHEAQLGGAIPSSKYKPIAFYSRAIPTMKAVARRFTAAASANGGLWTRLTVNDSSIFTFNFLLYLYPDSSTYGADGGYIGQYNVEAIVDATHVDILKVWQPGTEAAAGTVWRVPGSYDPAAPQTDKIYKVGPVW